MSDWRAEKMATLRYKVAFELMGDDYEVAHSGHIWPSDDAYAVAERVIEIVREFDAAKAIEARRAATTGAVEDESAVPQGFAPTGDDA